DNTDPPSASRLEMYPEGDVVLIIGSKKQQIRVDSACMKSASPVFRAMFGPHFSEGQGLSNASPKNIALPDDGYQAMRLLCAIIHHRHEIPPEDQSPRQIFDVVILSDKYDCHALLFYPSFQWLVPKPSHSVEDLLFLIGASYSLKQAAAFARITRALIYDNSSRYKFLYFSLSNIMPFNESLIGKHTSFSTTGYH
ncbi:hypothetical protein K490DRAFT_36740, partial [Saccharata proteae CBS 121410]